MGQCLLLVEDEREIREQLRELFEDEGFDVVEAQNGSEAFDALEGGLMPAMVFMDLMMPVMNGWQLLALMREDKRMQSFPVMVSSAACDRGALPADVAFIGKPFSISKLLTAVHAQLHS